MSMYLLFFDELVSCALSAVENRGTILGWFIRNGCSILNSAPFDMSLYVRKTGGKLSFVTYGLPS